MLEFLIGNIYFMLNERICQQTVSIPMGTNCFSSIQNVHLFVWRTLHTRDSLSEIWKESLNLTFYFIDDALSQNSLFSLGTPVSSTNKTVRYDITEILLKVALNTSALNRSIFGDCLARIHCIWIWNKEHHRHS
jgi:hypothetical protein